MLIFTIESIENIDFQRHDNLSRLVVQVQQLSDPAGAPAGAGLVPPGRAR